MSTLPCPVCKCRRANHVELPSAPGGGVTGPQPGWQTECASCLTRGPVKRGPDPYTAGADDAWNSMPRDTHLLDAAKKMLEAWDCRHPEAGIVALQDAVNQAEKGITAGPPSQDHILLGFVGDILHQLTTDSDLETITGAAKYKSLTERAREILAKSII